VDRGPWTVDRGPGSEGAGRQGPRDQENKGPENSRYAGGVGSVSGMVLDFCLAIVSSNIMGPLCAKRGKLSANLGEAGTKGLRDLGTRERTTYGSWADLFW